MDGTNNMSKAVSYIDPPVVHATGGAYHHVSLSGDFMFIAGQVSRDLDNELVGRDDFDAQARQAFRNLLEIVAYFGLTPAAIVKLTAYLVRREDLPSYRRIRQEFLTDAGYQIPPTTLLFIQGLAESEYLVEIEAVVRRQ